MGSYGQPLNFDETDPAAPSGTVNVVFQADAPTEPPTTVVRNISAYVPAATATTPGGVPTPPNDQTQLLCGDMAYRKLVAGSNVTIAETSSQIRIASSGGGGGGGGTPNISQYLSPATITPPSGLSWAYHANAVSSYNANGAMVLTTKSSSFLEVIGESIPSGDFDLIACFAMNPPLVSSTSNVAAILLWDSGSGKIVRFMVQASAGGNVTISVQHDPSFTSGSPVTASTLGNLFWGWGVPLWMRLNFSYSKYTFYVSVDGQSWDQVFQESYTAYLPVEATNAGIGIYATAATPVNLVIPHFVVNSYVGS